MTNIVNAVHLLILQYVICSIDKYSSNKVDSSVIGVAQSALGIYGGLAWLFKNRESFLEGRTT